MTTARIITGDVREVLPTLPSESVQCVVTSPPYWGLRDYGVDGQMGLEQSPTEYVAGMVAVFREVWRVLRPDGTCWLNLGDSYSAGGRGGHGDKQQSNTGSLGMGPFSVEGVKPKQLLGIPWRVAFALQDDGWYLRSDIIWHKPNPMPESVRDRPTKAHEYLFLLTKQPRYYYDADAIREPAKAPYAMKMPDGWDTGAGGHGSFHRNGREKGKTDKQRGHGRRHDGFNDRWDAMSREEQQALGANKRSVWTIATHPYSEAHFATFPLDLVLPCILAGSSERGCCPECGAPWRRVVERESLNRTELPNDHPHYRPGYYTRKAGGDDQYANGGGQRISTSTTTGWEPTCTHDAEPAPCTVLDPFSGAGTVGVVALRQGRNYIGVELNSEYVEMSRRRIHGDAPLMNVVEVAA